MTYNFSNRVVLVTGGTGALGRRVVQKFIKSGSTTIASYIYDKEAEDVKSQISGAELIKADTTKEHQIEKMVSTMVEEFGRIDVLVNVVGGYLGGQTINELDETDWDKMMGLNLKSAYLITKHVVPIMKSSKYGGKIVHVSSRTGLKSDGYDSAYAASKAGLIRLVESISQEVKGFGINVNCILPSTIDTEANRKAMPTADFSKWVNADDLANVILFLCSQEAKAITGASIPTYGLS